MAKNLRSELTSAGEDYLKAIYKLHDEGNGGVSTQSLAASLSVSSPSASAMMKKLAGLKLVEYSPYHGVTLTTSGEKIALETIRHHRLVETYLVEILGVDWDKVHDEADRWEHVLSEEVEAKMAAALGHPTRDPHGAPIPSLNGEIPRDNWTALSNVAAKTRCVVRRISDERGETLRHLRELGIVPNVEIEVTRAVENEGVIHLRVNNRKRVLGMVPAQSVFVEIHEK